MAAPTIVEMDLVRRSGGQTEHVFFLALLSDGRRVIARGRGDLTVCAKVPTTTG